MLAPTVALGQPSGAVSLFTTEAGNSAGTRVDGVAAERGADGPHRIGRVDLAGLGALRREVLSGRPAGLRVNLFRDVEYQASLERSAPTASGYTLSGPLEGVPLGRVVLVVNDGAVSGRVYAPLGNWSIRTVGTTQTVERLWSGPWRCGLEAAPGPDGTTDSGGGALRMRGLDRGMDAFRRGRPLREASLAVDVSAEASRAPGGLAAGSGAGRRPSPPAPGRASSAAAVAADDGDMVDVLVVYPSFVREIEGPGPLLSLIDLDIATANEAYAASGVELRVRLAAAVEVEYDWFLDEDILSRQDQFISLQHWYSALEHLVERGDGYLDEVHALRDRHAADLVLLHLGGEVTESVAYTLRGPFPVIGLAFGIDSVSAEELEDWGFSIARSGDGTVVAHELGHSMGLRHERYDDRGNEPFPYSHGFTYEHTHVDPETGDSDGPSVYGTIMSRYANKHQRGFVLAFSNPEMVHPQDPELRLGVPGDDPSDAVDGPADAARHLNELRGVLANVRSSADADPCRYELTGDAGMVPAGGGTYRLRVETQPGCPWTASAGEWASLASDSAGVGSADIEYRVPANEYWKRSVEILVAGKLHARSQTGTRPITPVCERSGFIRYALMRSHPDYVEQINPPWHDSTPCGALDFSADYLASIRSFNRDRHNPRFVWRGLVYPDLRPGDFDGLTGIFELWLSGMERIPPDMFAGMTGLRTLNLSQELFWDDDSAVLRAIEPGALRGVRGLKSIFVRGHRLRRLEAGTFAGLPGLLGLEVTQASAGSLAVDGSVFGGLSELRALALANNGITALDADLFDGLTELRSLELVGNEIETLPAGVFRGLSRLRRLDLRVNGLEAVPAGAFDELASLTLLLVNGNRIARLRPGVFDGLGDLESLQLHYNRLSHLPEKAFARLGRLEVLELHHNRLGSIDPGTFRGLTELEFLWLHGNRLTTLAPDTFDGLSGLGTLGLANNGMRDIAAGAFRGLGALDALDLSSNRLGALPAGAFEGLDTLSELYLTANRLGTLRAGVFHGLDRLFAVDLAKNGITAFEPGVFEGLPRLRYVQAGRNRVRELAPGALRGLGRTLHFDVHGNPGDPFTFAPTPVVVGVGDGAADQPLEVGLEIASAAPFDVRASLVASGGSVSTDELRVGSGHVRSARYASVTPDGDGPVVVRIEGKPDLVTSFSYKDACGSGVLMGSSPRACYRGVRLAAGPPVTLYGIEDKSFVRGRGAETVDLASVFSYFLGAADYEGSSSDESIAGVRVEDGTLTVTPGAAGTAEVTVTATGADGETMTRRFTVTVRVPSVPLFLSNSHPAREGFVRVINHSAKSGGVRITAIDDAGNRHGPVRLRVRAHGAAQFNSRDLEEGNEAKRLLEGVGVIPAEGNWRLEFESDLDIEALSYVRTGDGFLTAIHDAAPSEDGVHRIVTFNPASNTRQASRLRVVNTGREPGEVTVRGVDDAGASPGSVARFTVPAGAAREFDAMQLEAGDAWLDGAIGDGEGKWRLTVESDSPIVAMSLLENTSTGHLTNLSAVPPPPGDDGVHHVALFPAAGDATGRQGFVRLINRSQQAGIVRVDAFDDAGVNYGPLELEVAAGAVAHFNSDDLELGASGKGLTGSTGTGEGDWRLELSSGLDIEVLAYARSEDGFLTAIHDVVAVREGRRRVALFNPGSNVNQVSRLRLANPTSEEVGVLVVGTDDYGRTPPHSGTPWIVLPAGAAVTLDASELEAGVVSEYYLDDEGNPDEEYGETSAGYWERLPLGDGAGKWQLSVIADPGVLVQSLLESPTGHLTNLSSAPRAGAR